MIIMDNILPIPVPPGETLVEYLKNWDMTQKELAVRLGLSQKHVTSIMKGRSPITSDTAMKLETVLGIPASFWLNLEALYQESISRMKAAEALEEEAEVITKLSYPEIAKLGWVKKTKVKKEKIKELRKFFGVARLSYIPKIMPACFRKSQAYNASEYALAAWLRKGFLDSQNIETQKYHRNRITNLLKELRSLIQTGHNVNEELLSNLFAEYGIAFVIVPHLKHTHVNGAVQRVSTDKILLQMSIKGKTEDIFWFSLFHEIAHIVLDHHKMSFDQLMQSDEYDKKADEMASDWLIPPAQYQAFCRRNDFTRNQILLFADDIGIHPGIIAGRLMHDHHISFSECSDLRIPLSI